jgi:hypothetical protein
MPQVFIHSQNIFINHHEIPHPSQFTGQHELTDVLGGTFVS